MVIKEPLMTDDEHIAKKVKIEISSTDTHDQLENKDTGQENGNMIKLRIWRPSIPKYSINPAYYDDIIKTFIRKTDYKTLKMLDPSYADQIEFTQDINKIDALKPQFEAKHLRNIDMMLLKEAKGVVQKNEKLMYIYYDLKKLERTEDSERCLLLLKAYINNTRSYLERIQELREFINLFVHEAEDCWMFLCKLQRIANKR